MNRLSSPIENLKDHYTVVVIGSGYGGGIAASRLARAGRQVCVLERGREFQPGEYPDTLPEVLSQAQIDTPLGHTGSSTGLYDLRTNDDINVFMGCGLGGTSLVNANVSLPADPRVFQDLRWPQELRDDVPTLLKDGYDRAREMLKPTPYPDNFAPLLKLQALQESAVATKETFYRPPINVTFQDGVNHVGVPQQACVLCGDCVTGCNHSAKNTVLMNYLPDAHNHGAEIYTQVSVRWLERKDNRWLVHYQFLDSGREAFDAPTLFVSADIIVLAAGTLGSTEILLRSKAKGLSLSDQVGHHFSGNGDMLAFTYDSNQAINGIGFGAQPVAGREPVGPCITGIIDGRGQPQLEDGTAIEEAAIPGGIGDLLAPGLSAAAPWFGKELAPGVGEFVNERAREWESLVCGPYHGAVRNTQTYLVMSHDGGAGTMVLEGDRLRIHWPGVGAQPIFTKANDLLARASVPLGGIYLKNPLWSEQFKNNLTTVHPLGGCVMAEDAERGVVNHRGQAFSSGQGSSVYPDLYVSDGSVIPRSLGVNPLLTISAVAERCCVLMAKDRGLQIDYQLPSAAPPPAAPALMGVRFTETMKGFFSVQVKDDFQKGFDQGEKDGSPFQFTLTIISDDLEQMLTNPAHQARAIGSVIAPALSPQPLTVTQSQFNLFVQDPDHVNTRQMHYTLKLTSEEGKTYAVYGFKLIQNDGVFNIWNDTATLYITVWEGLDRSGPVLGKGILKIQPDDFMRQLSTIEVTNAPDDGARLNGTIRFGQFFGSTLFDVYGGALLRANEFNPSPTPRKKRPLRMSAPEVHFFPTEDNVQLRLTRYRGGAKGPVMLSPGYGTSTLAFTIDTVDTNLPEYLFANGYDVWLFDYRASPELASSRTQFTLDDIATKDYPAAVAQVRQVTGAANIQVVVHCIGSMTFLMSMLSGRLQGVRSAVCSQLGFFPLSPPENQLKAAFNVGSFLQALGIDSVTTDFNPDDWKDILADALLKLNVNGPPCNSAVCRRIWLIYGAVYKHDQLNDATHNAIHEMFGVGNISTFNHILLMIRKGQIVDKDGNDVYLPNIGRLNIPIAWLQGAENGLFLPEGTERDLDLLSQKNAPELYVRIVIPNYGHMDCFTGKDAATIVYPEILGQLEAHN
jgi:cholesterol oxidase